MGFWSECGFGVGLKAEEVLPSLQGRRISQRRTRGLLPAVPTQSWRPSPSAALSRLPGRRIMGLGNHEERNEAGRWQVRGVTLAYRGNSLSRPLGMTPKDRERLRALPGGFGPDLHKGVCKFHSQVSTTGSPLKVPRLATLTSAPFLSELSQRHSEFPGKYCTTGPPHGCKRQGKQKDVLVSEGNLSTLTGWGSMLAPWEAMGPT